MPSERLDFIHHFEAAQEQNDKRVLLLLHGTGGDEEQLVPMARALAPGAAILSPRGKVSENGNLRFFRRLAEGVFDKKDLIFRANELADFVEAACRHYGLDSDKVIAVGFSNGANIAASLLLLRPEVLAGAVLLRPMVPIVPEVEPDLHGKAVLIAAGESDYMVSAAETRRLYQMLADAGADVTLHWEKSGHGIAKGDIQAAKEWMEQRK